MNDAVTGDPTALLPSREVRVAIVDDSDIIRERLTRKLREEAGVCVVGEATDARAGVALVGREHPDVVILDLRMPEGGGFRLLEGIKDVRPHPTTVVMTNVPYSAFRRRCLELGAEHFYDKSTEFERIGDVVRALAARHSG
ncbi:MAG: response regulator transcription factor [Dehalococcoidia bacterium]|nr:response regulator transcription factor [Dehalococcoidia bacterium]